MQNPRTSFITKDASGNSNFTQTLVVVGQSNSATAGLFKDLENLNPKLIDAKFGAGSHLASLVREVYQTFKNSIIKPKLWAVSYADKSDAVARILESTVSGTATESGTIKIKINSMNPDRIAVKNAAIMALRNTKGAYCGDYAANAEQFGSPSKANMGFNPVLVDIKTQDVVIEVSVANGATATAVASAINTAISATARSLYSSSVASAVVTLTAKHKGALSNFFTIEYLDIPAGLSIATIEDTEGSGAVVTSGILDIVDTNNVKLGLLDFDFLAIPYSYSISTLLTDAKDKWDNVLEYGNRCLDYCIFQSTAIDTSDSEVISDLAADNALSDKGINRTLFVAKLEDFKITGISDYSEQLLLESNQLSPIQYDLSDKQIKVGSTFTLTENEEGFVNIERKLNASRVRLFVVEKNLPNDFQERNYKDGTAQPKNGYTYNRNLVIDKFEYYRDILDGTIVNNSEFLSDWAGLLDDSDTSRANFSEYLNASISFDKVSKQLIVGMANDIVDPIKSIFITAFYS